MSLSEYFLPPGDSARLLSRSPGILRHWDVSSRRPIFRMHCVCMGTKAAPPYPVDAWRDLDTVSHDQIDDGYSAGDVVGSGVIHQGESLGLYGRIHLWSDVE